MSEELVGRKLGQYTVTEFLETGGMAEVYIAYQASMDRDVAIKVIRSDFANDEHFVARFRRESNVIAALEHPHILPVIDFGEEESIVYIVMRLVRGESLDHRLRHGKLKVSHAVDMVGKIGGALQFAHDRGIIHRDLKPNNILLDEHGNPYLTDFGIAKLLAGDTKLTGTQGVLGTPSYMAPEQWRNEQIDARSDIYSLGIMLYEMLTGNLPFNSATPYQMMYQHINETPPSIRQFDANLPRDLEVIVLKALAKSPEDRYQSVSEMVDAVNLAYHGHLATTNIMPQIDSEATMIPTEDLKPYTPPTTEENDPHRTFVESDPTAASVPTEASPKGGAEAATIPPRDSITLNIPKKNTYLVGGLVGIVAVVALIVGLVLTLSGDDGDKSPEDETPALTILAERVTVRSGPDETFSVLAQVERDSEFEIEAVNPARTWYQIMVAGQPGWVPSEMVRTSGSDRLAVVNMEVPTMAVTQSPQETDTPDSPPSVVPSDTPSLPTPTPTEMIIPTVVAMSQPMTDTFDSIATFNWDRNESNRYLREGRYHTMALPGEQGSGLAMAQGMPPVDDFRVEIELEDLSQLSSSVIYCVVFRVQDTANYYRFAVTSDGQAGLIKRINSQEEALPFTTIYNWDDTVKEHRLTVEMVGSEMVLYVDDRVVLRYFDGDIREAGGIGLIAYREGVHVAWDNLTIEPITHLSDPLSEATSTYTDDFDDNECQWVDDQSRHVAYLQDGAYHLEVPTDNLGIQVRCATLGWYKNVRIETTIQDLSEDAATYGVVFRQSADGLNYYRVAIARVGQVVLQKWIEDDPECQPCVIGMEPLPAFDNSASHRLVVEAVDSQFHVFIDGEQVMVTEDNREPVISAAGEFRFGAYLRGTHVVYDDLVLSPITEFTADVESVEGSALPDVAAVVLDQTEAPLVFSREEIDVNITSETTSPASLTQIPLTQPLQNFVVAATLNFETGADDDQCGVVYRADLDGNTFHWLDLTSSNFLLHGTAQSPPSAPEFSGDLGAGNDGPVEFVIIANGDSVQIAVNGALAEIDPPIVDDAPAEGDLFLWVYLSALHDSTCRFENVQVWSLD